MCVAALGLYDVILGAMCFFCLLSSMFLSVCVCVCVCVSVCVCLVAVFFLVCVERLLFWFLRVLFVVVGALMLVVLLCVLVYVAV